MRWGQASRSPRVWLAPAATAATSAAAKRCQGCSHATEHADGHHPPGWPARALRCPAAATPPTSTHLAGLHTAAIPPTSTHLAGLHVRQDGPQQPLRLVGLPQLQQHLSQPPPPPQPPRRRAHPLRLQSLQGPPHQLRSLTAPALLPAHLPQMPQRVAGLAVGGAQELQLERQRLLQWDRRACGPEGRDRMDAGKAVKQDRRERRGAGEGKGG